jgi:release factor glutamine methyltransferase
MHTGRSSLPRPLWKRVVRRIGKRLLSWRFRRYRPEAEPERRVKVAGLHLRVLPGVFNPALHFTSGFLANYLRRAGVVPPGGEVLDIGTGTGVLAIAAALANAGQVMAIDINPAAVECARLNARRYGLARSITVSQSDLFSGVHGQRFDLVLCNPPYFRGEPRNPAEMAYRGGSDLEWFDRFGRGLHTHLKSTGRCIITLGDAADTHTILQRLALYGWRIEPLAHRDLLVEEISLYALTPEGSGATCTDQLERR